MENDTTTEANTPETTLTETGDDAEVLTKEEEVTSSDDTETTTIGVSSYEDTTFNTTTVLTGTFSATNSVFNVTAGDVFVAEDVTADVKLTNNRISISDPSNALLRATNSSVIFTLSNQVAEGDIIADELSSVSLILAKNSYYMGIINTSNIAKSISVDLAAESQLILAGDSYIDTLNDEDPTYLNIYANGYKLYVAGQEVAVNGSVAPGAPDVVIEEETNEEKETEIVTPTNDKSAKSVSTDNTLPFIVAGGALLVIIICVLLVLIHNKKKNRPVDPVAPTNPAAPGAGRPDFSAFDDGPVEQPVQPQAPAEPAEPTIPPVAPTTPPEEPTPVPPANPPETPTPSV